MDEQSLMEHRGYRWYDFVPGWYAWCWLCAAVTLVFLILADMLYTAFRR